MQALPESRSEAPGSDGASGPACADRTRHTATRSVNPRTDPARFYSQRPEPPRPDPSAPGRPPATPSSQLPAQSQPPHGAGAVPGQGTWDPDPETEPLRRADLLSARTTVVLDVRECAYELGPAGSMLEWFELALDATTSVALTATRTSFPVHLRTTAAASPAPAGNWSNVGEVLDWLALVRPAPEGSLAVALEEAGHGRSCGELVVVSGTGLSARDRDRIWAAAEKFDQTLLIQVGPDRPEQSRDEKVRTLWARDAESLVLGWVRLVSR